MCIQGNSSRRFAVSTRFFSRKVDSRGRALLLALPGKRQFYRTKLVPESLFQDLGYWLDSRGPLYAIGNHFYSSGSIKGAFFSDIKYNSFSPIPQNEAYTFLAGSLGSLSLTIWFLPVLYEQIFSSFAICVI